MRQVHDGLFVGTELDCRPGRADWATVHACKTPCHQRVVGYTGSLRSDHPHYLIYEEDHDLYLNIIDPSKPLFKMPLFTRFLAFARRARGDEERILIHCNQGLSRAPSLALLYLAKVEGAISNQSFEEATSDYLTIDPQYSPGRGVQIYLREHWYEF